MPRKKLAALLGHKTTSQLCRWEEGSQLPNLCNALLLSHFLQMPVEFLFKDLLIGVTHFYRDPEAFTTLARTVIPQLPGFSANNAPGHGPQKAPQSLAGAPWPRDAKSQSAH